MDTVNCAYAISPVAKGVSGAWKVLGDDLEYYLAKFHAEVLKAALSALKRGRLEKAILKADVLQG